MMLTESGYKARLIDDKVTHHMGLFGAISIEGPKWCGKTWTALNHAKTAVYIMDPANGYANREAAKLSPAAILDGEKPLLIDEWQEVPAIWDAVRFACDRTKQKGLFLLTGSVTPKKGSYSHSGAGRISRIRMRTMTLYESGDSTGIVSLVRLFDGEPVNTGISELSYEKLIDLIIRGGWPENLGVPRDDAGILPTQYNMALSETDITGIDNIKRNPELALHLLAAVARINMTPALQSTIVADVQARFGSVSRQTVGEYISVLKRLYVVEEVPQWFPELRNKQRLRKTPKRMIADPSIAVSALKASFNDLAKDPHTLGGLFENLCLRDLMVYAEASDAKISHYHDTSGLEVDAIVELGRKWAAMEIKMGAHRVDEGAAALKRLRNKLVAKGAAEPAYLSIITGGGPLYTRSDGLHVIPIDCLKP